MIDIAGTCVPKSDQLNAEDFLTGPRVVTIAEVRLTDAPEQPLIIKLAGGLRPYKPCKTMRRLLLTAWGNDGALWVGRSMRLYRDPSISFGDQKEIGGIRISHLSHIPSRMVAKFTATRGRRVGITVEPLALGDIPSHDPVEYARSIARDAVRRGWTKEQIAAIMAVPKIEDMTEEQRGTFLRDLMHDPPRADADGFVSPSEDGTP